MALTAAQQWWVRAGGAQTNGGGFDSTVSGAGTNYADQDAAQLSIVDGATTGAVATLTSAAAGFTALMVGNVIRIASGTNFIAGYYVIVTFTNATTVVLDRACTSGIGVSGVAKVGGAFASLINFANGGNATQPTLTSPVAPGHMVNVRGAGTDNPSSPDYVSSGFWQFPDGDLTTGQITIQGYNGRPYLQGDGLTLWTLRAWRIRHVKFSASSAGAFQQFGLVGGNASATDTLLSVSLEDCYFDQAGNDMRCAWSSFATVSCWFLNTGSTSASAYEALTQAYHGGLSFACRFSDLRGPAVALNQLGSLLGSLVAGCHGSAGAVVFDYDSLTLNPDPIGNMLWRNTLDTNAGPGIALLYTGNIWSAQITNNLISNSGTYGIDAPNTLGDKALSVPPDYNAFFNNPSGAIHFLSSGAHDVALSGSPYVGAGDYGLNNTAGAGAACRGAGYPGLFPGGVTTGALDVGALQHALSLPATAFTLSGPASGTINVASTDFTVTPNGNTSGTFTPTPASGCTFTPSTLTWTGDSVAKTFTVTKSSLGTVNINGTFSDGLTPPANVAYTANLPTATAFALTGPTTGVVNAASSNFTVTPNGATTGTFTPNPVSNTSFTPATLTWSGPNDNTARTFTATKTDVGTVAVNGTFSDALTPPASINYTTSTAPTGGGNAFLFRGPMPITYQPLGTITPGSTDAVNLPPGTTAIYCGIAGTVTVLGFNGVSADFPVGAGAILPLSVKRVTSGPAGLVALI